MTLVSPKAQFQTSRPPTAPGRGERTRASARSWPEASPPSVADDAGHQADQPREHV